MAIRPRETMRVLKGGLFRVVTDNGKVTSEVHEAGDVIEVPSFDCRGYMDRGKAEYFQRDQEPQKSLDDMTAEELEEHKRKVFDIENALRRACELPEFDEPYEPTLDDKLEKAAGLEYRRPRYKRGTPQQAERADRADAANGARGARGVDMFTGAC